jgi:hypothetical protein
MNDSRKDEVLSLIEQLETYDLEGENMSFHIFLPDEIVDAQIGYSIDLNGNPLTGDNEGDWKESWFVIGHDLEVGDPIFVDLSNPNYPVFIAEHGLG